MNFRMFELFGFDSNKCKGNKKRYCAPWAGFYLAQMLGPVRPRLAAPQQNRGGRGTMERGGTVQIWRLAGGQGGRGGAQEHD
jgi:hypothetical protein